MNIWHNIMRYGFGFFVKENIVSLLEVFFHIFPFQTQMLPNEDNSQKMFLSSSSLHMTPPHTIRPIAIDGVVFEFLVGVSRTYRVSDILFFISQKDGYLSRLFS